MVFYFMKQSTSFSPSIQKPVRIWLLLGLVMVLGQIFIGGVTRLTDSGLSITEWEVVSGVLPPLNATQWDDAFKAYKVAASRQHEVLHATMSLQEFKWIYFWEYFHRLWARCMGLVFIIPFLWFLIKKWIPRWLTRRLGWVIILAAAQATMGWIMVKSGLNDDTRTWVSAYKLVYHLSLATILLGILYNTYLHAQYGSQPSDLARIKEDKIFHVSGGLLLLQIVLGGFMAGMRAGLIHNVWPVAIDIQGFLHLFSYDTANWTDYEANIAVKAWVQVAHRSTAIILVVVFIFLAKRYYKKYTRSVRALCVFLGIQYGLGVLTLIYAIGSIPLLYGSLHQLVAMGLVMSLLHLHYSMHIFHASQNSDVLSE